MRGWHQAGTTHLQENGARFKRKSSLVFKIREWRRETPPWLVETLRNNEEYKGWINNEKNLNAILESNWLMKSILTSNFERNLGIAPGKLEESGKILGKDLWVRAHSKETPLKWFKRQIAPDELTGLNEITTSKWLERTKNGNTNLSRCLQHTGTKEWREVDD